MKIYPTILAHTRKELKEQLDRLKWARKVQLDVMDGQFVPAKTYSLEQTAKLLADKYVQVHLMVRNPNLYLHRLDWADEIIYHAETGQDLIEKIRRMGIKAGICLNPDTEVRDFTDIIKKADIAQVMTVYPGQMGAKFVPEPLTKIEQIRRINPKITIGVDGAVSRTTIEQIARAAPDYAGAGSAIQKAENPQAENRYLEKLTKRRN